MSNSGKKRVRITYISLNNDSIVATEVLQQFALLFTKGQTFREKKGQEVTSVWGCLLLVVGVDLKRQVCVWITAEQHRIEIKPVKLIVMCYHATKLSKSACVCECL